MLGVTMQESGVSKVIAVRLAENGDVVERAGQAKDSGNANGDGQGHEEQRLMDFDGEDTEEEEIADGFPEREGN